MLNGAAPAVWVNARDRYLADFSLALLDALPARWKQGRYWIHRVQALARLGHPTLVPTLEERVAQPPLCDDVEVKEALEAMPRGRQRTEALALFYAVSPSFKAEEPARKRRG